LLPNCIHCQCVLSLPNVTQCAGWQKHHLVSWCFVRMSLLKGRDGDPWSMSQNKSEYDVAIPGVLVIFGSLKDLLWPVYSILSLHSVSVLKTKILNMNFLCELTIRIPRLPSLLSMAKAVLPTVELVNSVTSDSVNLFYFGMSALPASVCPLSWSHVQMDGEALDDTRYIACYGCQSPQFRSVNRITTKVHV